MIFLLFIIIFERIQGPKLVWMVFNRICYERCQLILVKEYSGFRKTHLILHYYRWLKYCADGRLA